MTDYHRCPYRKTIGWEHTHSLVPCSKEHGHQDEHDFPDPVAIELCALKARIAELEQERMGDRASFQAMDLCAANKLIAEMRQDALREVAEADAAAEKLALTLEETRRDLYAMETCAEERLLRAEAAEARAASLLAEREETRRERDESVERIARQLRLADARVVKLFRERDAAINEFRTEMQRQIDTTVADLARERNAALAECADGLVARLVLVKERDEARKGLDEAWHMAVDQSNAVDEMCDELTLREGQLERADARVVELLNEVAVLREVARVATACLRRRTATDRWVCIEPSDASDLADALADLGALSTPGEP